MIDMVSNDGLIDGQPQSITPCVCSVPKIEGSIKVSIAGIAAVQALEEACLLRPDRIDFMTSVAHLGSIFRRDRAEHNALPDGLVFYKLPQLQKCPVVQETIQFNSHPLLSDALQVFHNDNISCIHLADDTLADFMVDAPHEPCLSASEKPKMPLGRLRAFALERTSQPLKSGYLALHTPEKREIRGRGKIVYADINPYYLGVQAKKSGADVFSNDNIEINFLPLLTERGTGYLPVSVGLEIILRGMQHSLVSAFNRGKRAFSREVKRIGTLVVLDGKFIGEIHLAVLASSLGLQSRLDSLATQLRAELGELPDVSIGLLMQGLPRAYLVLQSEVIGILGCLAELLHGSEYACRMRNFQPHCCLNSHNISLDTTYLKTQPQFLPSINAWASLRHGVVK
jgi:hypothetical protein